MAAHLRRQIRDAVATILTGLPDTGSNVFDEPEEERTLLSTELPALRVYTDEESVDIVSVGHPHRQQRVLLLQVDAVVKAAGSWKTALEEIVKDVEAAMGASTSTYTAGNLARGGIALRRIVIDRDISTDKPVGVARLTYEATYFAMSNAPDVAC